MIQVLSAVSYMHNMSILHKDIKLENIVIVNKVDKRTIKDAEIKIIDFGLSLDLSKGNLSGD